MAFRGFSEIVFVVKDVPTAARFYREVVSLIPETEPNEEWAWFWAGEPGEAQRVGLHKGSLGFEQYSPRPEGKRWGPVHYAFHVPGPQLDEAVQRVRAHGVTVYGPQEFAAWKAIAYYFYDLDDNLVEFFSPK